jgi:hypothetical protein
VGSCFGRHFEVLLLQFLTKIRLSAKKKCSNASKYHSKQDPTSTEPSYKMALVGFWPKFGQKFLFDHGVAKISHAVVKNEKKKAQHLTSLNG